MSKLDELIKELCPNGVDYKELGEVLVSLNTGLNPRKFFRLNTEDATNYYVTIREIQKNRIQFSDKTDRINEEALILCNKRANLEKGDVLFSGTGTIGEVAIVDETPNNWSIKEGVYSLKPISANINSKFLMYVLQTRNIKEKYSQKVVGGTVKSITMADLKKIDIPVPPLEVQNEIVRILDNFTALTAELTAELTARKKQYSWYRDYLLKFENKIEIVKLGDIVEVYDGTHQTPDYKKTGIPFISVENIDNIYNTEKYISEEDYEKNYRIKPKIDDIFMTRIGTIGKCAIVTKNNPLAYYVSLALLRPNKNKIDSAYLKYIIESGIGKKELNKRILFTAVPIKINKGDIDKLEIPLPPLEVQKRIVGVLDNFEKICNDLNIGLPAEIEARQKQYEFYRNFLLTFKIENCTLPKTRQDKTRHN